MFNNGKFRYTYEELMLDSINPLTWTPVVCVPYPDSNSTIVILPGIPSLFESLLTEFLQCHLQPNAELQLQSRHVHKRTMHCKLLEGDIARVLTDCQDKFK